MIVGVSSLDKEVLLNPGETSHIGKHLSITVLTSAHEHGWMELTLCTEVCTSRPSSAPPGDLGLFGDCYRVRAVPRSVRSAESRGKRAGKGELGGNGLRVGSRYPQREGRGGGERFPS